MIWIFKFNVCILPSLQRLIKESENNRRRASSSFGITRASLWKVKTTPTEFQPWIDSECSTLCCLHSAFYVSSPYHINPNFDVFLLCCLLALFSFPMLSYTCCFLVFHIFPLIFRIASNCPLTSFIHFRILHYLTVPPTHWFRKCTHTTHSLPTHHQSLPFVCLLCCCLAVTNRPNHVVIALTNHAVIAIGKRHNRQMLRRDSRLLKLASHDARPRLRPSLHECTLWMNKFLMNINVELHGELGRSPGH